MKKRLFSFSALLLCSLLGFAQFSGSGSGTKEDPYLITSPDELFEVRNSPSSYYKLMNDIDLEEWLAEEYPTQGWVPIQEFTGTFDGNGHSISGLSINRTSSENVGLFGKALGATITNVALQNSCVIGGNYTGVLLGHGINKCSLSNISVLDAKVTGGDYVGNCVGYTDNSVIQSYVKTSVISGNQYVGGLAGCVYSAMGNVVIDVSAIATSDMGGVGGLVGRLYEGNIYDCFVFECKLQGAASIGGITANNVPPYERNIYHYIRRCYVSGEMVSSGSGSNRDVGGISGLVNNRTEHFESMGSLGITDCRFDGHITGTPSYAGGIGGQEWSSSDIARNIVSGSIFGLNRANGIARYVRSNNVCCADTVYCVYGDAYRTGDGKTTYSTYNSFAYNGMVVYSKGEKVEVEDSEINGIGYSLRLLKKKNTYIGFSYDFDNVWSIEEDRTFPYLKAQSIPPTISSCIGGKNGIVTGSASGNGTIYVFVGGKMHEGEVIEGQWSVPIANMPRGAVVNVYAETDGMKPSCKISTISEVGESFVELDETSVAGPEAATDVDVLLNRTINADEWSTICLPFTATGEQVKAAFGDDVQLSEFTAWESEEDVNGAIVGINVTFTPANADDGIAANKPMLIKVSEAVTEATFDGVTLEPEEEPVVQVGKRASERGWFYGTYAVMQVPEENLFLSGNKFWYSTGATTIKGYRGYFEFRDVLDAYYDGSEVKVNFFFDDEETGIRKLTPTLFEVEEVMYNLAGQRVDKAKKGIYIVNGKKQVIK